MKQTSLYIYTLWRYGVAGTCMTQNVINVDDPGCWKVDPNKLSLNVISKGQIDECRYNAKGSRLGQKLENVLSAVNYETKSIQYHNTNREISLKQFQISLNRFTDISYPIQKYIQIGSGFLYINHKYFPIEWQTSLNRSGYIPKSN